jgi:hypothetical protein
MAFCESCGKPLRDGTRFCSACGAEVAPGRAAGKAAADVRQTPTSWPCPSCGSSNDAAAGFCTRCGSTLGAHGRAHVAAERRTLPNAPAAIARGPTGAVRRRSTSSRRAGRRRLVIALVAAVVLVLAAVAAFAVVTRNDAGTQSATSAQAPHNVVSASPSAGSGEQGSTAGNAPGAIGDPYGGGVLVYILVDGDPDYVPGETHGLIAATADQTPSDTGIQWASEPYWGASVPGTDTDIGSGAANTDAIIAQNGAGSTYAAGLARAYNGGGHSDWYLPSKDELNRLYVNRNAIGGFDTEYGEEADCLGPYYWSSSEPEGWPESAWFQNLGDLDDGYQAQNFKELRRGVRAVRAF